MRRAIVVLLALGACAPADAATSRLVARAKLGPDVQRLTYRYGPLEAFAGQNLINIGPVTVEKPPPNSYAVRITATITDERGATPPVEQVHMHHAVFLNLSKADESAPTTPQRFYAFAEEKTVAAVPPGYGYLIEPTDVWAVNYMLHNETPVSRQVYVDYTVDIVPKDSPTGRRIVPVHPLWLDTVNGSAYPVFDVLRGKGRKGRYTFPDDARPSPYTAGAPLNEWRADRDITLVATAGHVHPGGLWTDLDVRRGKRKLRAFRSKAKYFDPNGPVSWDMAMTVTPPRWRVGVRTGDVLRVSATYETKRASWYESMGIMLVYYADRKGPDSFKHRPPARGKVTHGPLPEAQNHGGGPASLPNPLTLADTDPIAGGVGIGNFGYYPGDLSGNAGVPVVREGETIHFGNFDGALSIFHTVTSCRLPCNRQTGVSYPLANGPTIFDSGQLGGGPPGYTAAAQRPDWYTPKSLGPGTYAYFCRVHPFMRGAFRVKPR